MKSHNDSNIMLWILGILAFISCLILFGPKWGGY